MEDKPDNEIESLVNEAIRELDAHHTGMISQRDFMQVQIDPTLFLLLFLSKVSRMAGFFFSLLYE